MLCGVMINYVAASPLGVSDNHSISGLIRHQQMSTDNVKVALVTTQNIAPSSNAIMVYVKGMVCAFCAQGITKSFLAHDAIESVDVSMNAESVQLVLKKEQTISNQDITRLIQVSGYNVGEIVRP